MKFVLAAAILGATLTSAMAADVVQELPVASTYDWTGGYVGGQIGYAWGRDHIQDENLADGSTDYSDKFKMRGVTGGVFAGYNMQWGSVVGGIEGDVEASGIVGHNPDWPFGTDDNTRINAQGSLRGRLGYAFDNWLPYVTGGLAVAHIRTKFEDGGATDSESQVKAGWAIGAGVDYAFTSNWFGKVEYRYTDLGKITTATDNTDPGWEEHEKIKLNEIRIGIAYKF
ncbi:outer membrane protein [Mesorhizobium sp. M0408]|uniref:outer membrane protein n=1 Tax=Mesorhizobium sp. M0408 TaxID=2956942 RepID=UPI00333733F5